MPLPTDGFETARVTYTLATSNNLPVQITVTTNNGDRRLAFEEFQPYLETALATLRTDYANGTEQEVLYVERTYDATVRDQMSSE